MARKTMVEPSLSLGKKPRESIFSGMGQTLPIGRWTFMTTSDDDHEHQGEDDEQDAHERQRGVVVRSVVGLAFQPDERRAGVEAPLRPSWPGRSSFHRSRSCYGRSRG